MATPEDVKKLAALARVEVSEEELPTFAKEFEAVLAYVGQLDTLSVSGGQELLPYRNIMREDGVPHASGEHTDVLVEQFPARDGDSLSVKQIISHD
jgi:aspartyl-tRNA(Asn)/glutamyl-tRNA(Gln) amidotransferase subunit C